MAAKKPEDYKKHQAGYPSEAINPKLKEDKAWYIAQLSAMMHYYTTNNCEIPFDFNTKVSFKVLNAYAQGKQGNWSVKKKLLKEAKDGSGKFITKMKDIFQTYDILPELYDVIRAYNQKQDYEVNASCYDYDSLQAKEAEKNAIKFLIDSATKDFMEKMKFKPSLQSVSPEDLQSMTESDVDLFFDSGGYVMERELAAIAACDKTKQLSGYKEIENNCNDDLIKYGISGVKTYVDQSTGEVKMRNVDFLNGRVIIPHSKYNDFRDITRAAELRQITIAEVKEINPRLTGEEIKQLVEDHIHMNPQYAAIIANTGQYTDPYEGDPIDKCKVWVLDAQWLSCDTETYMKTKHPAGNNIFKSVKYDYKLNSQEEKKGVKLKQSKVIKKYQAIWVVGTEILLQYGVCKDVVYYGKDGNRTPRLDYFFAKTGNASLIERCIPHVDDINLYVTKLRNAVATLPPAPRMVIQQQLMDNVFLNGIKQQPEDLIQTLVERGYLIVNGIDDHGRPVYQNSKAVEFINTGLAEDVNLFNGLINDSINRMRQVLGLPEGLDGTAGNQYQAASNQQLAAAGSSNALFPTLSKISTIFQPAFDDVVKKWQVISKARDIKLTYSPLGSKTQQILKLGAEFSNCDLNIEMTVAPNDEQRRQLLSEIAQMQADYKASGGAIGVSRAEYLMLWDLITNGKIKMAMFKIAQIENKREMMADMRKKQDQQANIQDQQQSAMLAAEEARKTLQQEMDSKKLLAILEEAQKRKTGATTAYLKSFDVQGQPIPEGIYEQLMAEANAEIQMAMAPPPQEQPQQMA